MYLPEPVRKIISALNAAGYEAYAVGGCVRDHLMGREPDDYDVTTSALPQETAAVFAGERLIETGIKHGTVTVLANGMPVEVTTYRIDGEYSDHRHPDRVSFTSDLTADLARRDFTVNAMAYAPQHGIIDPFGGQEDLARGCIRCVGDAEKRFDEDALRILRALRFASTLGFTLEPETERAAFAKKELLRSVSAERLNVEFTKLLCGKNVRFVLCRYIDIIGIVIPEALAMKDFAQRNPHHIYDVLEHTAAAVEAASAEPVMRLSAFLHDIGKPLCFTEGADGIGHFYGHAARSAELAEVITERLRYSTAVRRLTVTLVREHDLQIADSERAVKRVLNRLTPEVFFRLLALKRADNLAQAPEYAERQRYYDRLESIARTVLEQEQCFSLKDLAVNGHDLAEAVGLKGPAIGAALAALLDAVIAGEVENEKGALLRWYERNK